MILLFACGTRATPAAAVSAPPSAPPTVAAPDPGGAEFLRLYNALTDAQAASLPDCEAFARATHRWAADHEVAIDAVRAWKVADGGAPFRLWREQNDAEFDAALARSIPVSSACLEVTMALAWLTNL